MKKFLMTIAALMFTIVPSMALEKIEDPTRLPGNEESWVSLAIVFTSVLTAWFLNQSKSNLRVLGILLAASGCLFVATWFGFFVLETGFLENPKPNQTPMDSAKPTLLWVQGIVALLVGLGLLLVARKHSNNDRELILPLRNEPERYGMVSRLLHWTTAILFLGMIPIGIFASIIPEDTAWRTEYYVVHKTLGVILFGLILARLVWNRISRRPALDSSLKEVERKMAHRVHLALYGLLLAFPVTGFIMTSYHGAPTFFFAWELEPLWGYSEAGTIGWGLFHKYILPYLLYVILGTHILGALKHHFIDRHEKAIKRMVS